MIWIHKRNGSATLIVKMLAHCVDFETKNGMRYWNIKDFSENHIFIGWL